MIQAATAVLDAFPGEEFLTNALQNQLNFLINGKIIKRGRLLHFRKHHFCIIITILSTKNNTENIEIPLPFQAEIHDEDGKDLAYFDYRMSTIIKGGKSHPSFKKIMEGMATKNTYFNKILEIVTQ